MDEIVVDPGSVSRFGIMAQQHARQPPPPPTDVPLTAAGLPRKKPGRKPANKPKVPADGSSTTTEAPKQRRPRKPRDPNLPPIQRKRKAATAENGDDPMDVDSHKSHRSFSQDAPSIADAPSSASGLRQPKITELTSMRMSLSNMDPPPPVSTESSHVAQKTQKREAIPGSMRGILNDDDEPALAPPRPQQLAAPTAPIPAPVLAPATRQIFDPVRGNYDPVRETMLARDPYGTGLLGSPRAPTSSQIFNRASASPSIASLVDPVPSDRKSVV